MAPHSSRDCKRRIRCGAVWIFLLGFACAVRAETVVFQLHSGDRITGTVLSESTNAVVIATPWAKEITLPLEQIAARQPLVTATSTNRPSTPPAVVAAPVPAATNAPPPTTVAAAPAAPAPQPVAPKPAKLWKADTKIGMDLIYGAKDRQLYYGQFALTYAKPQRVNPKKYFRNIFDYRVDYAETDGVESANRMSGSNKTDWDIGSDLFIYNFMGVGYDEVRRIDLQYELGPGLGYHLVRRNNFVANVEGGLNYQVQDRANAADIEAIYARCGEDFTWKIIDRVTFTHRGSLLVRADNPDQMQLRMEANLSLGIVKNLSLNLTAIELYDTRPVPGVSKNEFQLRSSIGLTF